MSALLIAHELVCMLLFVSVFCRFVRTDHNTRPQIRFAFWVLGSVAALGMAWPVAGWPLAWFGVALAAAVVLVQWVTSVYWRQGPPAQFCNTTPEQEPRT